MSEIKTKDIIKSLRVCGDGICSPRCVMNCFASECHSKCRNNLALLAADRLERLATENELLQGTLASCGAPENAGAEHFPDAAKMMLDGESIMQQAIKTYGVQAQCDVAVEEMAELTKAIVKIRRVADDYEKTQAALENLLEEIADVDIMIEQMKIMWGPKQVEEYRKKKLERLERRLNDDHS